MTRKVIALLDDNADLKLKCQALREKEMFLDKQMEVLKEQVKKKIKENYKILEPMWEVLEDLMREKLPEDYNEDKYRIGFNLKEGTFYYETKKDDREAQIRRLLGNRILKINMDDIEDLED